MTFKYITMVDYADTDAGGVVYHSRYLDMAERARSAWLRHLGTSNSELQQQGYLFVVRELHVQYQQPARLDDELAISIAVQRARGASLHVEQVVSRDGEALVTLTVQLACLNAVGKPTRIPQFLTEKTS